MVLSRHEPACHVSSPMSGCSADPSPNHSVVNNGKKTRRNDSNSTPPPHDKFRTREGRLKRCKFVLASTLFDFVGVLRYSSIALNPTAYSPSQQLQFPLTVKFRTPNTQQYARINLKQPLLKGVCLNVVVGDGNLSCVGFAQWQPNRQSTYYCKWSLKNNLIANWITLNIIGRN
jgi:hypothetical protein